MVSGATAVVVDEWPLIRLGVTQTLRSCGVRVVAEASHGEEALHLAQGLGATFLFLGAVRDTPLAELVRRAVGGEPPVRVVVLVDHITRDELAAVVSQGVDALLQRTSRPDELTDAITRIDRGERVVAPALLSVLVGVLGPSAAKVEPGPGGALTRKEREVLARMANGMSNKEIADALFITPATVKTHLAHIYTKLGVAGRQEALARAVALGLLS